MRLGRAVGFSVVCVALGFTAAEAGTNGQPYAVSGTGISVDKGGSTLTVEAVSAGPVSEAAAGTVVWNTAQSGSVAITVDCLSVHASRIDGGYGIGHIAIGSGIGSDGIRYHFRTQKDGDSASFFGSGRLSTTADLDYKCGTPMGGYFFTGEFRAFPPVSGIID